MPGGILMAVILIVLFPMAVVMGCCAIAATLGSLLHRDGEQRHEGSELIELNN